MLIGYAGVSTDTQNLALQRDALKGAGCARIFEDQGVSGATRVRPGFDSALAEFERALIVERATAGLKAAKERGIQVGRRKSLTTAQVDHARLPRQSGERAGAIARSLKVSRSTLYRALAVVG